MEAPPSNKHPSCRRKFEINSLPLHLSCERVMRQQRMYSFRRVVLDLHIVSVCEYFKSGKKNTSTNGALAETNYGPFVF